MTRPRLPLLPLLALASASAAAADAPLRLWYERPAATWDEALPNGNGRLGAMVFGDARRERLALNEDTLWSGGPREWNNPDAKAWLPKRREAVFAGRYVEADALAKKMQGPYNQSYQPLGDLLVDFEVAGEIEGYRRELDLDRAVVTTTFRAGGATHTREAFASFPDQVIVLRAAADRPGRVSFVARLASRLRASPSAPGGLELRPFGSGRLQLKNDRQVEAAISRRPAAGAGVDQQHGCHRWPGTEMPDDGFCRSLVLRGRIGGLPGHAGGSSGGAGRDYNRRESHHPPARKLTGARKATWSYNGGGRSPEGSDAPRRAQRWTTPQIPIRVTSPTGSG